MKNLTEIITEKLRLTKHIKNVVDDNYKDLTIEDVTKKILFNGNKLNKKFFKAVLPVKVSIDGNKGTLDDIAYVDDVIYIGDKKTETFFIKLNKDDILPFFQGKECKLNSRKNISEMNLLPYNCQLLNFYANY